MDALPDELVCALIELLPDSRPFGLTCRRMLRLFCESPDVAYWCSGGDMHWLLPKMVPEVWNGSVLELIRADNLPVLLSVCDPDEHRKTFAFAIYYHNAVEIFRYLHAKSPFYDSSSAYCQNAWKIIEAVADFTPPYVIFPSVLRMLYRRIGKDVKKYRDKIAVSQVSIDLRLTQLDELFNDASRRCEYAVDVVVSMWGSDACARVYSRIHTYNRAVVTHGSIRAVQKWVQFTGMLITPVLLAIATRNIDIRVFPWLYTRSGADLPAIATVAARKFAARNFAAPNFTADSRRENLEIVRFYSKFTTISHEYNDRMNISGGLLELLLEHNPARADELMALGCIPCTDDNVKILAQFGKKYVPTAASMNTGTLSNVLRQLRIDPGLVGVCVDDIVHALGIELSWNNYAAGEALCAEFAAIPGIGDVSAIIAAAKRGAYYVSMMPE